MHSWVAAYLALGGSYPDPFEISNVTNLLASDCCAYPTHTELREEQVDKSPYCWIIWERSKYDEASFELPWTYKKSFEINEIFN